MNIEILRILRYQDISCYFLISLFPCIILSHSQNGDYPLYILCTRTNENMNEKISFINFNKTHSPIFKRKLNLGLHFQPTTSMELQGYSDADQASCPDDHRSTSGYYVFIDSNLISQSSSKQSLVSKSSVKSEYRGLVSLTAELVWIQSLLQELCLPTSPPILWYDNQSAAHLVANPIFHSRSKHIELDLYFIRDKVLRQELHIYYVSSSDQLVDLLTKHLPISQFCSLCSKLTITNPPLSMRWGDNQTS